MKNIILIVLGIIAFSCQKDVIKNPELDGKINSIPQYSTFQDVMEQLETVKSLSLSEIRGIEIKYGFRSFSSKCQEVYDQLRNTDFDSQDEMINAIMKYPEYVELKVNGAEMEVEPVLCNSIFRYIMNEDRLFRIGNNIYKVFEDGVLVTNLSNLSSITEIKPTNGVNQFAKANVEISLMKDVLSHEFQYKDVAYNIGAHPVNTSSEQSKRRVKLELWTQKIDTYGPWYDYTSFRCLREDKQKKKVLGIWWNYNTTLDVEYDFRFDWETEEDVWDDTIVTENFYNIYEDKFTIDETFVNYTEIVELHSHFGASDSRATTDDITNYAVIVGNTFLL